MSQMRFDAGTRFSALTVEGHRKRGVACRCDCGRTLVVTESNLLSGRVTRCSGCEARNVTEHGFIKTLRTGEQDRKLVVFKGDAQTVAAWARKAKLPARVLSQRLSRGWSVERALKEPVAPRRKQS